MKKNDARQACKSLAANLQNLESKMKIDPLCLLIKCIEKGKVEDVFTDERFDQSRNAFVFKTLGYVIAKEFFDDVVRNPEHYKKMAAWTFL